MDSSEIDQLSDLLGGASGDGAASLLNFDGLIQSLMPFIIIITILTVVLTLLYAVSLVNRWRANQAIIEIRDMLRDMKQANQPPTESE